MAGEKVKMETMGINTAAGVREERIVFWHWVSDVTTAFNLSITVMGLGGRQQKLQFPHTFHSLSTSNLSIIMECRLLLCAESLRLV